jgi:Kef-type K+ transport system membrane component KefB
MNEIFFSLAIIIIGSKILGAFSRKFNQPPVIGMLLLGIVLGPSVFHLIEPSEIIIWIGKTGVLFLLFEAGLETDLKRIKKDSKQAALPAAGGIILPFALGFALSYIISKNITQSLIIGVIFTATSVSVSVMTLLDLGKLKGVEGRCIVNAAIIDDIVGILLLTFIFGFAVQSGGQSVSFIKPFINIIVFFVGSIVIGLFLLKPLFNNLKKLMLDNVVVSISVAVVMLYSWFAEHTGLAAITGAYFAGLFIGQTNYKHSVQNGISVVGKSFFVDVFFVTIGLEFNLFKIDANPWFIVLFVGLAIFGKLIGSGLGAKLTKFDSVRSFRIGAGMIPRGEVALIVANMALAKDLITQDVLSATIFMVIVSAVVTPLLLKFGFVTLRQKAF